MIKFCEIVESKEYRERVIKFFRLPIRLSVSKEKFLSDLDFIRKIDVEWYDKIIEYTERDFNKLAKEQNTSEPDFSMEDVLAPILKNIESSEKWQSFIKKDYSDVLDYYNGITSVHGFYKEENHGKHFISVDLKSANWQSLQRIIGFNESYEELIVKYTDNLIPPASKTFRTKITGVLGAKNIMYYNKKLLKDNKYNILKAVLDYSGIDLSRKEPFAFYADEFLIEVDEKKLNKFNSLNLKELQSKVYEDTGIEVHITPFTLRWLGVNKSCAKVYSDGFEILNVSKDILLVMIKLINKIKVEEVDFEGIRLKNKTKEEFIEELKESLKLGLAGLLV